MMAPHSGMKLYYLRCLRNAGSHKRISLCEPAHDPSARALQPHEREIGRMLGDVTLVEKPKRQAAAMATSPALA